MQPEQTFHYDVKVVVFGRFHEVYKYMIPQKANYTRIPKEGIIKRQKGGNRSAFSLGRTRNTVRRLVAANFDAKNDTFLTLTFADNIQDLDYANKLFKSFIRSLRLYLREAHGPEIADAFKYLAVLEFQKRGAIHYHVILGDVPFLPFEILTPMWPYGWYKLNRIEHVRNVGAYVSKYLYKDVSDPRLRGKRAYQSSRNLTRPFVIVEKNTCREILSNVKRRSVLVKKGTFDNDFTGRVYYRQYERPV
jgi:hypothetical protein